MATRSFVCPNCREGSVSIPGPAACSKCGHHLTVDQMKSLKNLENGLKTYIASLIECIDECQKENADITVLEELRTLIDDPPGIASIASEDKMRFDLCVIRAKYFLLKNDIENGENELNKNNY